MSDILTSRSHIVCDWVCPRKRFYNYEYGGKGIVKGNTSIYLHLGTCVHDSLAAIAHHQVERGHVDIDDIAIKARLFMIDSLLANTEGELGAYEFANEQGALVEGLVRGFYVHVWPSLIAQYPNIVAIEQEMQYRLGDGMIFMSKPDLIMGDQDGELHYIEYKTTSSKKEEWINSWNTAVQLHSTIRAVEQTLGKAPSDVTVVGLYKGYVSYGKQNSPFCYAYRRAGNPPFTQDQFDYEYRSGFKRHPVWEMDGGVAKWVANMPPIMLSEQFPCTPPIFIKDDLIEAFFKQTATRELKIYNAMQVGEYDDPVTGIDAVFPQRFDQCVPAWGSACSYRQLCHGPKDVDPLSVGFQYRESHHALEANQDSGE